MRERRGLVEVAKGGAGEIEGGWGGGERGMRGSGDAPGPADAGRVAPALHVGMSLAGKEGLEGFLLPDAILADGLLIHGACAGHKKNK